MGKTYRATHNRQQNGVRMYTVIAVTGGNDRRQGGIFKGEFETFDEAEEFREKINQLRNVHIKMPDGSYWPQDYKT